jgi:hypothetical protein
MILPTSVVSEKKYTKTSILKMYKNISLQQSALLAMVGIFGTFWEISVGN